MFGIYIIIVVMGTEVWSLGLFFLLLSLRCFVLLFGIHWLFCLVLSGLFRLLYSIPTAAYIL
jgi:hypothetical protein